MSRGGDSDGGASLIGGKGRLRKRTASCGRLPPAGINPSILHPSPPRPRRPVFYLACGGRLADDDDTRFTYIHTRRLAEIDGARLIPIRPLFSSLMCSLSTRRTIATLILASCCQASRLVT